jgi:hypothetical protein
VTAVADTRGLTRDLLDEYKAELGDALDSLKGDELVRVERLLGRLAVFGAAAIADPTNAGRHRETVEHLLSSLSSIGALSAVRMQAAFRDASIRVATRAIGLVFAAI